MGRYKGRVYRRHFCDTKRLNAAGKWIGGRGRSLLWYGIGAGTYYRGELHRAIRRAENDYAKNFANLSVSKAIEFADSDASEDLRTIARLTSEVKWRAS